MRETWSGSGDTLERAAIMAAGDAALAGLYARFTAAAELAARMTGLLAEAARAIATGDADPRWPGIVADLEANAATADGMAANVAAEAADHRAGVAVRAAGLEAWARDVYGAPALAMIAAAGADHAARRRAAGDPRDVPEPGELAASWRRIADTLEAIVTAESPDPAAVDTEAASLAESARLNGGGA